VPLLDDRESANYTVPHGVTVPAQQKVTISTRACPKSDFGGRTLHIHPADLVSPKIEPANYGKGRGLWTAVR